MSKSYGQKITLKFTEKIVGDLSGLILGSSSDFYSPKGIVTFSRQYYGGTNIADGNLNTFWNTNTTGNEWIQVKLNKPTLISGFRWYLSDYPPKNFNVQGSNDGLSWTTLFEGESPNARGWQNFTITDVASYEYVRWNIISSHSGAFRINEIEIQSALGNEGAFTVTGNEYEYVNSELKLKKYNVSSVSRHPTLDESHISLNFNYDEKFRDVEGSLNVKYNQEKGNLGGSGGFVESFEASFLPSDLDKTINPNEMHTFTVNPIARVDFTRIYYKDRLAQDKFKVNANATLTLTYVGVVNP